VPQPRRTAGFWCRDIARGGAARVRAVAEAAVARVTPLIGYTKADQRLRHARRGTTALATRSAASAKSSPRRRTQTRAWET